jgi:hypothetical protein
MMRLATILVIVVASGAGVLVGRRRGPAVGFALGVGVWAAGALGYFALLALTLPM